MSKLALLLILQFVHVTSHINPSAETLRIFTRDMKLIAELDGWELLTLPDETVIYHRNQVHFAPTHSLEIAAYNPSARRDKVIYPPMPYQPVRRQFIERVAEVYKQRGEAWFREHNHHGDSAMFDSRLMGDVTVDAAGKAFSFRVRFGDPDNANDPLPFTQNVTVTCKPLAPVTQIQCQEVPAP